MNLINVKPLNVISKPAVDSIKLKNQRSFSVMASRAYPRAVHQSVLHLQKSDLSVIPASDDDFFNYTTKRWLFNEAYELSKRYVHFNIPGLFETAVKLVGNGATRCVHAMKFQEGQFNKAFLLVLDNDAEVVAKIPNPNAGPAFYTTASEVATMDYLRKSFKIPIPNILGWSSTCSNAVGSEYIIMEKAKGIVLGDLWYRLARPARNEIIQQVVELETLLASWRFSEHGCLFYAKDIPSRSSHKYEIPGDTTGKFRIGPVVDPVLWEDGRSDFNISKGPWSRFVDFAVDIGRNEKEWVTRYAQPRMNYFRYDDKPEPPAEMLDLIEKYLSVVPYTSRLRNATEDLHTSVLWHPDLHLNNVFIDPKTNIITDIIDWQGSQVAPLVLQARLPRMFRHVNTLQPGLVLPKRQNDYESLDAEAKLRADKLHESALCQKYYEVLTAKTNPSHYSAILHNEKRKVPFIEPVQVICGAWKNREIYKLRSSLIRIKEYWEHLDTDISKCPIVFTEEEVKQHDEELDNMDYIESMMEAFEDEGTLPADGRVDPQDFESLKRINQVQKERYLNLAENEVERVAMGRTWPWQDWPERSEKLG